MNAARDRPHPHARPAAARFRQLDLEGTGTGASVRCARSIERIALAPVMFELGARPHPPRSLYRAYLEQSDVFIGIYWESYGWVAPGEDDVRTRGRVQPRARHPDAHLRQAAASQRAGRASIALLDRIRDDDRASVRGVREWRPSWSRLLTSDLATPAGGALRRQGPLAARPLPLEHRAITPACHRLSSARRRRWARMIGRDDRARNESLHVCSRMAQRRLCHDHRTWGCGKDPAGHRRCHARSSPTFPDGSGVSRTRSRA